MIEILESQKKKPNNLENLLNAIMKIGLLLPKADIIHTNFF
jgi:hypothetical protein